MPDGYSFCIKDKDDNCQAVKFIADKRHSTTFNDEPLLQQSYLNVYLYNDTKFALWPLSGKDTRTDNGLITPTVTPDGIIRQAADGNLICDKVSDDIMVKYTKSTIDLNTVVYTDRHYISLIINKMLQLPARNCILVETTSQNTTVAIKQNHRLILANTYPTTAVADSVYYIMDCVETLGIDRSTPMYVIDTAADNCLSAVLKPYLNTITDIAPRLWEGISDSYKDTDSLKRFTLQTI